MTTIARTFQPNLVFEQYHWKDIKEKTWSVCKGIAATVASAFLYWQTPAVFWSALIYSIPFAHCMRDTTSKIIQIWEKHSVLTLALLSIGSFLALPWTLLGCSIVTGGYWGSELHISSVAFKMIDEYQEYLEVKLSPGEQEAFYQFLCEKRNILVYNDLFETVKEVAVLNLNKNDAYFKALPMQETLDKDMLFVAKKTAALWAELHHHRYETVVRHNIDKLLDKVVT